MNVSQGPLRAGQLSDHWGVLIWHLHSLPLWQWITRELHSSLTRLLLFNVTSAEPPSAPLSREITAFSIFYHTPGEHAANILKESCI